MSDPIPSPAEELAGERVDTRALTRDREVALLNLQIRELQLQRDMQCDGCGKYQVENFLGLCWRPYCDRCRAAEVRRERSRELLPRIREIKELVLGGGEWQSEYDSLLTMRRTAKVSGSESCDAV